MGALKGVIITLLLLSGLLFLTAGWWGMYPLLLGITLVVLGMKKIPADPPHKGVVTVWGKKTQRVLNEGWKLLFPYFPFNVDVILVKTELRNFDFIYSDVRCLLGDDDDTDPFTLQQALEYVRNNQSPPSRFKSGGSVTVEVAVKWKPDTRTPGGLVRYIDAGKKEGAFEILNDTIGQEVRQIGRYVTWEEYTSAQDDLTDHLLQMVTGDYDMDPRELRRKALQGEITDECDLGILIERVYVKRVEPEDELNSEASRAAIERQQRRAEEFEAETLVQLVEAVKKRLPELSDLQVLNAVQAERGKISRMVVDGSASEIERAAGVISQSIGRR